MNESLEKGNIPTPEQAAKVQTLINEIGQLDPRFRDPLCKTFQKIFKKPADVLSRDDLELLGKLYRITPELADQTPLEPAILTINDVELMSKYSLVGLNGDINAGKTPLALMLACMAINPTCGGQDEIAGGLKMTALQGNVLYIDTEIEKDRLCHTVRRSWERRLGHKQRDIARLYYYPLRHVQTEKRLRAIELLLKQINDVCFVVVDSLTQMTADKMDFKEATRVIDGLFEIIDKRGFPIFCTIHGNRGDATGKATGHIGAVLQEKASTYLRLMIHPNDEDQRILTASFPNGKVRWGKKHKANAAFAWNNDIRGFVETEYIEPDTSKPDKKAETQQLLYSLYRQQPQTAYSFKELAEFFERFGNLSHSTAQSRVTRCANGWELLRKGEGGLYCLLN